jgi:pimeloyl-ACP methyl ester carboxylesterase
VSVLRDDNVITLSDARRLGYAEYGDPDGEPVFLLHGNPNSRLLWGAMPGCPFRPDLRFIAPDRPGYGLSDFFPQGRGVADYPDDVVALADQLGINRFTVFGASGGGPYALACAWKIPERLTAVGIFASMGPNIPEATTGITPPLRLLYCLAVRKPWSWMIRLQTAYLAFTARHFLSLYLKIVSTEMTDEDKAVYRRLGLRERLRLERFEAFRQGGRASFYDTTIPGNWPIPLEEISTRVYLWQGEADHAVGGMGRYLAQRIPKCEATFIPGAGHFWIFEHMGEILDTLVTYQG